MAVPLAKEVLRAVQDAFSLHQTLLAEHAIQAPDERLRAKGRLTRTLTSLDMVAGPGSRICMVGVPPLDNAVLMESHVLDRGRWLGEG